MTSITDDILTWSEKYLEPKNKHLGDVPVCPYARMARLKKTYRILECHDHKKFLDTILEGVELAKQPDIQIVIVGCDDIQYEVEEIDAIIHAYNLVFVPQDICRAPAGALQISFIMILIQKFDELEKASDNLRKTGYYDKWPSDYYGGTVLKRQSYRRYRNARSQT